MMPSVALVILNWNNAPDTLECLRSLLAVDDPSYQLLVVDNGSSDDSANRIRESFPGVTVIETGTNLGYAGGNNWGIRIALTSGAEVVGILNNDITVEADFLGPLIEELQSDPRVGVATPLIGQHEGDGGAVWALGSSVDDRSGVVTRRHAGEPISRWRGGSAFRVDAASGAAMLFKAEVLRRAGLPDEDYFLYYEEIDWSLVVRRAGYDLMAVPRSVVWHKVSATLGVNSPAVDYYMLRNYLRLLGRQWTGAARITLQTRVVLRQMVTIVAYTCKSHEGARIPHRNARLLAIRDALLGRWGRMSPDVARACGLLTR